MPINKSNSNYAECQVILLQNPAENSKVHCWILTIIVIRIRFGFFFSYFCFWLYLFSELLILPSLSSVWVLQGLHKKPVSLQLTHTWKVTWTNYKAHKRKHQNVNSHGHLTYLCHGCCIWFMLNYCHQSIVYPNWCDRFDNWNVCIFREKQIVLYFIDEDKVNNNTKLIMSYNDRICLFIEFVPNVLAESR